MGEMASDGRIEIKPGWIIRDCSSASGGVKYNREYTGERQDGDTLIVNFKTRKVVDHMSIVEDLDAVARKVEYVFRKTGCTRTTLGWFAADENLPKVRFEIERLVAEARALNETAARMGSLHRAYISVVPLKVDMSTPEAAREIARTIHDALVGVFETLKKGEIGQELAGKLLRARHIDQLATGFQAEALRAALETIVGAKQVIRERVKKGEVPAEIGPTLDLGIIESAIQLFRPLELHQGMADPVEIALQG